MSRYPLGQPVRLSTTVRDLSGSVVDAGTITLQLRRPDGTIVPFSSPVHDGTGLYHQDLSTTDLATVGHYAFSWVTTGTGAGRTLPAALDVYDPWAPEILSVSGLKTQLSIAATNTTQDEELAIWCAITASVVESMTTGPILIRSVTEQVYPTDGGRALVLSRRPVSSITSITDEQSGSAMSLTQLISVSSSGVVRQKLGVPFYWTGPFTVVYQAGFGTTVEPEVEGAARIIGQHLWETRRGPVTRPALGGGELVVTPAGYLIPRRAQEMLADYLDEVSVA